MVLAMRSSHRHAALSSCRGEKQHIIKDDGLDSSGTYRNIARNQASAHSVLGTPTAISWKDICQLIANNKQQTGVYLNIVDTIICLNSLLVTHIYTDTTGRLKVSRKCNNLIAIANKLIDVSKNSIPRQKCDFRPHQMPPIAVLIGEYANSIQLVDESNLRQIAKAGRVDAGIEMMTAFIHPRGSSNQNAGEMHPTICNFRYFFALNKLAKPSERFIRLNIGDGVTGKSNRELPSKISHVNKSMSMCMDALIRIIENCKGCRVINLVADFVVDVTESVWLVRVSNCDVAHEPRFAATSASESLRRRNDNNENLGRIHCAENHSSELTSEFAAHILGSTQLENSCKGDFCGFDVSKCMGNALDLRNVSELDEHLFGSCSKREKAANEFESKLVDQEQNAALKELTGGFGKTSRNIGFECEHDMPYNIILLARKEKHLVDAFLRRYREGEKNVQYMGVDDARLGEQFPGHFYRPVKVCSNCYNIYNKIRVARTNSIESVKSKGSVKHSRKQFYPSESANKCTNVDVYARACTAMCCVTKGDLAEIRSFTQPPPAVLMVVSAVMVLLRGSALEWKVSKSNLKNGDRFLSELQKFDPAKLTEGQGMEIGRYVRNPYFRPEDIISSSKASAKLCAWVLGAYVTYSLQRGYHIDERTDPLLNFQALLPSLNGTSIKQVGVQSTERKKPIEQVNEKRTSNRVEAVGGMKHNQELTSKKERTIENAKALCQQRKMSKLSKKDNNATASTSSTKTLLCSDETTRIPYEIFGEEDATFSKMNFVVCHDLFDTIDMTKLMFLDVVKKHIGCQVLLFNLPGQAGTTFPRENKKRTNVAPSLSENRNGTKGQILNNEFIAHRVHELLEHVNATGEFFVGIRPFHFVGIGAGLPVVLSFCEAFGKEKLFVKTLKSIVSVNGFASIDSRLTAILHATLNVFRSFPTNRPDLPVSYFTRFLFSDEYLNGVTRDLALNIYTAVMNPITLEGRIRLCAGVLNNRDMKKALTDFDVPLIAMQSTENIFVSKENISILVEGRNAQYVDAGEWADKDVEAFVPATLRNPNGALVLYVNSGHAVSQQCKRHVVKLFDTLACPNCDYMLEVIQSVKVSKYASPRTLFEDDMIINEKCSVHVDDPEEIAASNNKNIRMCDEDSNEAEAVSSKPYFHSDVTTSIDETPRSCGAVKNELKGAITCCPKSKCGNSNQANMMKDLLGSCDRGRFYTMSGTPSTGFSHFSAPDQNFAENRIDMHDLETDGYSRNKNERQPIKDGNILIKKHADSTLLERGASTDVTESRIPEQSMDFSTVDLHTPLSISNTNSLNGPTCKNTYDSLSAYLDSGLPLELIPAELLVPTPTKEQKQLRRWQKEKRGREGLFGPPSPDDLLKDTINELNFEKDREKKFIEEMRLFNIEKERVIYNVQREQEHRRNKVAAMNDAILANIGGEKLARERNRAQQYMQQRVDVDLAEDVLNRKNIIPNYVPPTGSAPPVRTIAPTFYRNHKDLYAGIPKKKLESVLDGMEQDAGAAKKMGAMRLEEFERVEKQMAQQQMERDKRLRNLEESERVKLFERSSHFIQRVFRGHCGRKRHKEFKCRFEFVKRKTNAVVCIQKLIRGANARVKAKNMRQREIERVVLGSSAFLVQRIWRGHQGRKFWRVVRRIRATVTMQKVVRGFLDRRVVMRKHQHLALLQKRHSASVKIQCNWRAKMASDILDQLRLQNYAATEIQRCSRGRTGRKKAVFTRDWLLAKPGAERVELGLKLIEDSKEEFERHRKDIDTLHRIQEKAETRVNQMYQELKESEQELHLLEDELQELGNIEEHMHELQFGSSFEQLVIDKEMSENKANPKNARSEEDMGKEESNLSKPDAIKQAESKIAMQVKKVERERKKQRVESELAIVISEIEEKRSSLEHIEETIADMEATRQRKDREFARLQRDLMKLLDDQKCELDELRGKGIELETATATSAAAAEAAAHKAKKYETQTTAMFHKHEDMLKFQFMSMSLNYFSSLNMLKEMRQMSSDTTTAAISASLQTASSAAAAASAAMMPGKGAPESSLRKSALCQKEKNMKTHPPNRDKSMDSIDLPGDIRKWNISDVSLWLQKLSLGMYVMVFQEASIDGEFLLDLREEDLEDVLGIEHKLHRRKILLSRQRVVSEEARNMTSGETSSPQVSEVPSDAPKTNVDIPPDVVFSQARHGRLKRLEESLDNGFDVNTEDEFGNSLLMIAVQNRHFKIAEILLSRGALLNHVNSNGNSALHFAFAYDTTGELGQYLIENGADDTIENSYGCTPYDGIEGDISG
mmetsp:Transcript_16373/g.24141  ORF Transcript_16373/g.24141 Transcript_16373/m.24141 type:complete len:2281 (-) Transcript_16373:1010-7852(-)